MTEDIEVTPRRRSLALYAWIIVPAVLLLVLIVGTFFRRGIGGPGTKSNGTGSSDDNSIVSVRNALGRQTDLATCRTVVTQLNTYLQKTKNVEPLPEEKSSALKSAMKLDEGDLEELNASTFTPLDAYYLEMCFLLRDAAKTLEVDPPAGRKGKTVKQTSLDRARMAFDWVCRQVRLTPPTPLDPQPASPTFVLRRGTGSALERAVVFVSLLEQFGMSEETRSDLQGCLLFIPNRKKQPELWACGVISSDEPETMYLFDPRMGIALPGPDGKGVATLKQALTDAKIFEQLKSGDLTYDITPDKVKTAEASVCVFLTAQSPRMRRLQDSWLVDAAIEGQAMPPAIHVKLADEQPGALKVSEKAFTASGGQTSSVNYWRDGAALLRRFVPKDEGGSDEGVVLDVQALAGFSAPDHRSAFRVPRQRLLEMVNVPWQNFPPALWELRPDNRAGQGVRGYFMAPYLIWFRDPNSPRNMILRGQSARATPELIREQEYWRQAKERAKQNGMDLDKVRQDEADWSEKYQKGVAEWRRKAFEIHGAEAVANQFEQSLSGPGIAELYKWKIGDPMDIIMSGAMAEARAAQLTYQLGLSKHEQSVRLRTRTELAERAGSKTSDDDQKARASWKQTEYWWKQYLADSKNQPGQSAVRRLLAEAHVGQNEKAEAMKVLSDTLGTESDLEKLALAWLAAQAK